MKIGQMVVSLGFLLLVAAAGCAWGPESTQIFEFRPQSASGPNLRLVTFKSDTDYPEDRDPEVRAWLDGVVNGGRFNIVSVKTVHSSGYLTAAEVTYDASGRGDGNNVRVTFALSDKDCRNYREKRDPEVRAWLDDVVNGGRFNIVKVQTTYDKVFLVAAEVYYRSR